MGERLAVEPGAPKPFLQDGGNSPTLSLVIPTAPLEDEMGDVLEKAMKLRGLSESALARKTGIDINRIKDAILYRYDFSSEEIAALSDALGLNEPGFRALIEGRYPVPCPCGLPFQLHVLAMPYGVGVVNAYIVAECGADTGILIDSGCCCEALQQVWPACIRHLDAHLVTHWDSDHGGGCEGTRARFGLAHCFGPGPERPGVRVLAESETMDIGAFRIEVISTPGPAAEHYCYLIRRRSAQPSKAVLFTGDLFFCGSIGGGFFDDRSVLEHARRLWTTLPSDTIVAPGHGPLTTIGTEREFNPFSTGC